MRLSRYFLPVLKENPSEAQIVSHRYMLRAGMIKQSAAGIYSWLPLGFKVLKKIESLSSQGDVAGLYRIHRKWAAILEHVRHVERWYNGLAALCSEVS